MNRDESQLETLRIRRVFAAPPARVFRAWTVPEELKKWWRVADGWTTPLAEVDLRVGGRFALGTKPPDGEAHVVRGEYQEVSPPNKLVYTWHVEGRGEEQNLVTVEFRPLGEGTEVLIKHRVMTRQSAAESGTGWEAVLRSLQHLLE